MLAFLPLISFGLIRLHKLECLRNVSTSSQNSPDLLGPFPQVPTEWLHSNSRMTTLHRKVPISAMKRGGRRRPLICGFAHWHLWPLMVVSSPNHTHAQTQLLAQNSEVWARFEIAWPTQDRLALISNALLTCAITKTLTVAAKSYNIAGTGSIVLPLYERRHCTSKNDLSWIAKNDPCLNPQWFPN